MTTEYALDESPVVTIGADGTGETVPIGPSAQGEVWHQLRYSVSLSAGVGTCRVYRGFASSLRQIDVTTKGQGDTSDNPTMELRKGEFIVAKWTGATVGAIATFHIEGRRTIPGRRAYAI